MKPIDKLLNDVKWEVLPAVKNNDDTVPCATHSGILQIGTLSLRVYQLSNGKRVIAEEDLIKFFGGLT